MTKIKLFADDNGFALIEGVNEFIKDKHVIDIKYQSNIYSSKFNGNGTPANVNCNDRILVVYEE